MSDSSGAKKTPDYAQLTHFLLQPFLENPESLSIDAEFSQVRAKVWIRVAFGEDDRGRIFGRGGRNIHAVRAVLEGIAKASGHSAHLEVYGGWGHGHSVEEQPSRRPPRRSGPSSAPKRSRP